MTDRYPGYDVLRKRNSMSWNDATRRVVDQRLAVPREPRFFTEAEWQTLNAVCDRIVPQPKDRPPVPTASYVDEKLRLGNGDGYRHAAMPNQGEAWRRGLAALDEEARRRHGDRFHAISPAEQDALLRQVQEGEFEGGAWGDMPCKMFFSERIIHDVGSAYYSHPTAWNELGYPGPASPRGFVRMDFDRRDPWEAVEAKPGREEQARKENLRVR
ncbi:MAG: gluconate 2-dehydrogenase subunit 3 family protein [Pseudomonadota bacterium]|nr:gluconate 2-dehydrogenase subunit 3 family protein [Pseudomonadota bacterium]